MIELELKKSWKKLILQICILVGILCSFLLLFIVVNLVSGKSSSTNILTKLTSSINKIPVVFLPFLGLSSPINLNSLNNYLLFINMFISIFFVVKAIYETINIIENDYHTGLLYSVCNQLMDRHQLIIKKLAISLINFFSVYICYCWFLFIFIFVSEINSTNKKETIINLLYYILYTILIYFVLISISFFIGCIKSKDSSSNTITIIYVLYIFILSNIYKIFYVIEYLVCVKSGASNTELIGSPSNINTNTIYYKLTYIFRFFKIISCFSWLNAFSFFQLKIYIILLFVLSCVLVSSLMIYWGIKKYEKRDF